jgi:serine/threonine-protein kinase
MADPRDLPPDPLLSQAETFAGDASAFQSPPRSSRTAQVPEFPVQNWDRYEFLGFLGQGGMGMVFRARDRRLDREVAIKFVRLDEDRHVERFMVEARAQARVDHEHVCKVFEVGEVEGRVFIAMQHIVGASLDAAPGLSLEQKVIVLRDAARGVHEAHRVGIIHRDLKPSNIMVERTEDGACRTFVMDFGLARDWNQDVTETGSVLGTPAYMSPEQARGEVSRLDRRTDVYSLGATLYHITTGRPPFAGANALEILSAIASADAPPMRSLRLDIPRDLEAITLKCLEKERARRYDSAKALADDLERFLAGEPVRARPAGLLYRMHRRFMRHKALAVTGTVAFLLVLIATGTALKTRHDAGRRERLARQFTESMARIESMARYSALSPLHDIRPDLKAVQAHMAQLQEDMRQAGSIANGPGHYALGRGYLTLDDDEKAREHLQLAWDAGYREPRVAYALAVVIGRRYQEKLLEAERSTDAAQRDARKKELEATLRTQALGFLRQAKGADLPSPAYLEALMAFYEGRLDEALDRLKAVGDDLPWFYEAPLLRGSLLQARAWKRWNQGERDAAQADFEAGRAALTTAAASGRSAPVVYAAMAELELNALLMEKYGQGEVESPYDHGMLAVETALVAQSDHVPTLILQSALEGHLAEFKRDRGQRADDLVERAVASASKAVEAESTRSDARVALGRAYYHWGSARADQNLNPTDQLTKGLHALESLSPEKRDFSVETFIGAIHLTWSEYEGQHGQDPAGHLNQAIVAYERITQMEPHLYVGWINLANCFRQRGLLPTASRPVEDLSRALTAVEQGRSLNPKNWVPHFLEGGILCDIALHKQEQGEDPKPDLQRSVEAYHRGIAINPLNPNLHNGFGITCIAQARLEWEAGRDPRSKVAQAKEAYRKAVALAPNQVFGYQNLGDLLIWQARWEVGPYATQALQQANAFLRKGLKISPGHLGSLANLGRMSAVWTEKALRTGLDPSPNIIAGEAALAKGLAQDSRDRDTLQYLGELRSAAAKWKAIHHRAKDADFDKAEHSFHQALGVMPSSVETLLSLVNLYLYRAQWERVTGRNSEHSLSLGRDVLSRVLQIRPNLGEALALKGGLDLEEAETLQAGARITKGAESVIFFKEAFTLNQNLIGDWKIMSNRAQNLSKVES